MLMLISASDSAGWFKITVCFASFLLTNTMAAMKAMKVMKAMKKVMKAKAAAAPKAMKAMKK